MAYQHRKNKKVKVLCGFHTHTLHPHHIHRDIAIPQVERCQCEVPRSPYGTDNEVRKVVQNFTHRRRRDTEVPHRNHFYVRDQEEGCHVVEALEGHAEQNCANKLPCADLARQCHEAQGKRYQEAASVVDALSNIRHARDRLSPGVPGCISDLDLAVGARREHSMSRVQRRPEDHLEHAEIHFKEDDEAGVIDLAALGEPRKEDPDPEAECAEA